MGGGIGQWLLYRAGNGSLSLFSLVVLPAPRRGPRHLAWGLVGLYTGTQDEEIYARPNGALELVERRALAAGDFYSLILHATTSTACGRRPRDVRFDSPAHERHRLRLAALVRPRVRSRGAVPIRVRQTPCDRRGVTSTSQVDAANAGLYTKAFLCRVKGTDRRGSHPRC